MIILYNNITLISASGWDLMIVSCWITDKFPIVLGLTNQFNQINRKYYWAQRKIQSPWFCCTDLQSANHIDSIKCDSSRTLRTNDMLDFSRYSAISSTIYSARWMFVMKFNFENISICTRISVIAIVNFTTEQNENSLDGTCVMCDTATDLIQFVEYVRVYIDWFSISSLFICFMSVLRTEFPLR